MSVNIKYKISQNQPCFTKIRNSLLNIKAISVSPNTNHKPLLKLIKIFIVKELKEADIKDLYHVGRNLNLKQIERYSKRSCIKKIKEKNFLNYIILKNTIVIWRLDKK